MRRGETDFGAYVAARWPGLVRGAVEAGVAPDEAPDVARDALSRCRGEWLEAERHGDVDAVVEDALAAAVRRHRPGTTAGAADTPPTADELDALTRARRRRARRRMSAAAVPLAALVAAAVWWTARGGPDVLDDAAVTVQEDQSQIVWYADGELHLAHVVLTVGPIRELTALGDAAVYGDPEGRVVSVAPSGARTVLGHQDPDLPLRASAESGWVAWVDSDSGKTLVVDVASGEPVATRTGDRRVIAVDGQTVYLRDHEDRLESWAPATGTVQRLEDEDLLDVRGRRAAIQSSPTTITVVQLFSQTEFTREGRGAILAVHGGYVTTEVDGVPVLYDTLTGLLTRSGLRHDDTVLAAAGGSSGATTYVVRTAQGQRLLEDCVVQESDCTIAEQLDPHGPVPLLAH